VKELPTLTEIKCELGRRSFWNYLKLSDAEFFTEDKEHLKELAQVLQNFYERKLLNDEGKSFRVLILNLPPRTGKSYTLTRFCQWVLGVNNKEQIATVSYNIGMAGEFSRFVRDGIIEMPTFENQIVYNDIFPNSVMKDGDASAYKWALESNFFSYIGTGFNGTLTGKGFSLGIIDDPIKSAEEAYNERVLEGHYNFYKNTFRSRIESGGLQIINHTRWSTQDLAGRVQADQKGRVYVHKRQMENDEGELLCPSMVNREDWEDLKSTIDPDIINANYQQTPLDIEGGLYNHFNTYEQTPKFTEIRAYCDTADTGADFLCSIAYGVYENKAYVLDVIYDNRAMEFTEPITAKQLNDYKVNMVNIESNNGGRGFARNIQSKLKSYLGNRTVVKWFHQSKNKEARIFSNSYSCQERILFPIDWARRWPAFYKAIMTHSKEGKNKHDDAADTLTGVEESFMNRSVKVRTLD
jgi:predicted phage terminase large subunit-like protein